LLTSRQIFWYAVPARTVTKKALLSINPTTSAYTTAIVNSPNHVYVLKIVIRTMQQQCSYECFMAIMHWPTTKNNTTAITPATTCMIVNGNTERHINKNKSIETQKKYNGQYNPCLPTANNFMLQFDKTKSCHLLCDTRAKHVYNAVYATTNNYLLLTQSNFGGFLKNLGDVVERVIVTGIHSQYNNWI